MPDKSNEICDIIQLLLKSVCYDVIDPTSKYGNSNSDTFKYMYFFSFLKTLINKPCFIPYFMYMYIELTEFSRNYKAKR